MGREILFRGKRIDNDSEEWVYGSFVTGVFSHNGQNRCVIMRKERFERYMYEDIDVDPETVCQYTGLTDKNGRKIFEGDILKRVVLPTKRIESNFRIAFVPVKSCFSAIDLDGSNVTFISDYINCNFEIEVIGNIFDNPDLLEGEIQQYRNIEHKATCEWIPCSELLPEEDGFYQVTVQIKETGECYVEKKYYKLKKGWDSYLAREFINVIAWMPLPEPYKLQEMRE